MPERREGPDRRIAVRRVRKIPVAVERRSGSDRRWAFRRDSDIEAAIRKMIKFVRDSKKKRKKLPSRKAKRRPAKAGRRSSQKTRRLRRRS